MKETHESRGSNQGTQSDASTQQRGSQPANQGNRAGSNPGRHDQETKQPSQPTGTRGTQQSAGKGVHAGTTGVGSGQTSSQTDDSADTGRFGPGGSGSGSDRE